MSAKPAKSPKPRDRDYIAPQWKHLSNKAMARKLSQGEAIDISAYRAPTGIYALPEGVVEPGMDYCDAKLEAWIWSIGRELTSARRIFASTDGRFYQNATYQCLWLR